MADKPIDNVITEIMPKVMSDHFNPLIPTDVIVQDTLEKGDTAYFDFLTNRTHVSRHFVAEMSTIGKVPIEEAVNGILTHEIGHYVRYPRECSVLMFLGHIGEPLFKEYHEEILGYFVDVMDNLPHMLKKNAGKSLRSLYRGMNTVLEHNQNIPNKERELLEQILKALGKNPEEVINAARIYSVDRLLIAYYQKQTEDDLGIDITGEYLEQKLLGEEMVLKCQHGKEIEISGESTGKMVVKCNEEKKLVVKYADGKERAITCKAGHEITVNGRLGEELKGEKVRRGGLMDIDFTNMDHELQNFVLFGNIVVEILKKRREKIPQIGLKQKGKGDGGGKEGVGGSGWTTGNPELDKLLEKIYKPLLDDGPTLNDFSEDQLNKGLDDVIRKWGKQRYEKIREYVERMTGKKFDPPPKGKSAGIGLGSSQIHTFDNQIPYYERLASTYGLYIHRKPIVTDVTSNYPEGSEKFKVGDPIKTLNPFSTGGRILPGITKRHTLKQGKKQDRLYKVPDLTIWLDTSGSMDSPESGSHAVLAAFMLARNYYKNGSKVGVCNFSADMAMLIPTRDLEAVYSMLCAYWGGGTVLNIDKVKQYVKRIAESEGKDESEVVYTTEDDYKKLVERMDHQEQKQFMEKSLELNIKGKLKETYERMDTVMITDGGIANIDEVVAYINSTAEMTRNTIFLVKGGWYHSSWEKMELPNTQIVPVEKKEDLRGLAIGKVKKLAPPSGKPTSLFG